jgi:hypothetical protein
MSGIMYARYGIDDKHLWSMDVRHAEFVKAVALEIKPDVAVEVGCHLGVSTLAILEAGVPDVHLIDPGITPSVRAMAGDYGAKLYEEASRTALPKIPPSGNMLVLLDGDHSYGVVSEELSILERMTPVPRVIVSHDVTSQIYNGGCEGCMWLWHVLQAAGWLCFVDALPRSGERTHRGLLVATRSTSDHAAVVKAWKEVNK